MAGKLSGGTVSTEEPAEEMQEGTVQEVRKSELVSHQGRNTRKIVLHSWGTG